LFAAWGCVALSLLVLLPLAVCIAFIVGAIKGQLDLYHARAEEQASQMRSYIRLHENSYSNLEIEEASNGWSYFSGTVTSQTNLDFLTNEMQRLFGKELGERMTSNIEVLPAAPSASAANTQQQREN